MRVLVVEDNYGVAESLVKLLQLRGHDVWHASNKGGAIELLDTETFDVALVDWSLMNVVDDHDGGYGVADKAVDVGVPEIVLWSGVDRTREYNMRVPLARSVSLRLKGDWLAVLEECGL